MNRIKRVSFLFRVLFQFLLITMPVLFVAAWLAPKAPESLVMMGGEINLSLVPRAYIATSEHATHILHVLSNQEKLMAALLSAIPLSVILYVLYTLVRLFKLYELGEIFTLANVRYIRNIGYAILLEQIIDPFYQLAIGYVLTAHNPPHNGFMAVTFDQANIDMVLTALMVILISWIMAEGCQLREEQQLTI